MKIHGFLETLWVDRPAWWSTCRELRKVITSSFPWFFFRNHPVFSMHFLGRIPIVKLWLDPFRDPSTSCFTLRKNPSGKPQFKKAGQPPTVQEEILDYMVSWKNFGRVNFKTKSLPTWQVKTSPTRSMGRTVFTYMNGWFLWSIHQSQLDPMFFHAHPNGIVPLRYLEPPKHI